MNLRYMSSLNRNKQFVFDFGLWKNFSKKEICRIIMICLSYIWWWNESNVHRNEKPIRVICKNYRFYTVMKSSYRMKFHVYLFERWKIMPACNTWKVSVFIVFLVRFFFWHSYSVQMRGNTDKKNSEYGLSFHLKCGTS